MKIDVLTTNFVPVLGGAEIALYNMLDALSGFGDLDIELLLPHAGKRALDRAGIDPGYPVHGLPPKFVSLSLSRPALAAAVFRGYRALARRRRPDLAWFNMFYPMASGVRRVLEAEGIPYVIAGRGVDIQKLPEVGYGYRLDPRHEERIREIARGASRAIAISGAIRDSFLDLGVPPEKIVEIPNAIDVDRIAAVAPADLEAQLGLPPGRPVLITVGRYTPKKGYEYVPEIAARLVEAGPAFSWLLVGRGIEENIVLPDGLRDSVRFVEDWVGGDGGSWQLPPDGLVAALKAADLFVFPTKIEGLSNVVLEAMAAGLPVVTSDVPGCREIVDDGVNGLMPAEGDTAGFAAAVGRLLGDEALRRSLVAAGRETVARYARRRVAGEYRDLLMTVAGAAPGG